METGGLAQHLPATGPPAGAGGSGPRWRRRLLLGLTAPVAFGLSLLVVTNLVVISGYDGEIWPHPGEAASSEVAIVPGAMVNPDGSLSTMLADRVAQAAALFHAGKVTRILVSGDHGSWSYDEPTSMRRALVARGVPAGAVFTDHAGFNTRATMERARRIFGVRDATVVTQGFHMKRSLFLAGAAGIEANGLVADLHDYGRQGIRSDAREVLTRTKAVFDVLGGAAVTGGEPVPISGPASASWGPEAPEGTPPAGAPAR